VPQVVRVGPLIVQRDTVFEVIKPVRQNPLPQVIGEENI
jgi:hypothetical protein